MPYSIRLSLCVVAALCLTPPISYAQSDEFDAAGSIADWTQVATAGAPTIDIDTAVAGHLAIEPDQSIWFQAQQAPYLSKAVTGDFAVEARVRARSASNPALEVSTGLSFAGLLARDPVSPAENWTYIALGFDLSASEARVTDTTNSVSSVFDDPVAALDGDVILCRVGTTLHLYHRPIDGTWILHSSLPRPDLPNQLHIGPMAYEFTGAVDLVAQFDYVRFGVPANVGECTTATVVPPAVPSLSTMSGLALIGAFLALGLHRTRAMVRS